jgi:hypothetical protein
LATIKKIRQNHPQDDLKILTGIMYKRSPALFAPWQERYVMLEDKKLKYFKFLGAKYPCGVLNFDNFLCTVKLNNWNPLVFIIKMVGSERVFEFKT